MKRIAPCKLKALLKGGTVLLSVEALVGKAASKTVDDVYLHQEIFCTGRTIVAIYKDFCFEHFIHSSGTELVI